MYEDCKVWNNILLYVKIKASHLVEVIMIAENIYFDSLLSEFENNCPTPYTREQYTPKVKLLLEYLAKEHSIINEDNKTIESFFKYSVTSKDLIESTVYYIEQKKLNFEQAINDFIIAFNQFFKFLNNSRNIENTNWIRVFNNSDELNQIYSKIKLLLAEKKINLKPQQKYPPLTVEFNFVNEYLNKSIDCNNYKNIQVGLIFRLFLLLGLKPEKLFELSASNLDLEYSYLKIPSETNNNNHYKIHLPQTITFLFKKLMNLRIKGNYTHSKNLLLFSDSDHENVLESKYTNILLKALEKQFYIENLIDKSLLNKDRSQFTHTGFAKYAIINMIKANIPQSLILDFTGNKTDIYDDCHNFVNSDNLTDNNRYIDSKIRSIETFDIFDFELSETSNKSSNKSSNTF